jgi:hypothetical protein
MEAWLVHRTPSSKPLLLHGPPQSGKKTHVRDVFTSKGYRVVEPGNSSQENWKQYLEVGFHGPQAYLMSVAETGMRALPCTIGKAPVVYVCNNPFKHGKKADLEVKYELLEWHKTGGRSLGGRVNPVDTELKPWEVIEQVGAPIKLQMDAVLRAIDRGPPVLTQNIVYWNTMQGLSEEGIYQAFQTIEQLSLADTSLYKIPEELQRVMDTVIPIRSRRLHLVRPLLFSDTAKKAYEDNKVKTAKATQAAAKKPAAKRKKTS